MLCKLAKNNANDLNKVLKLTSPCMLCGFPQTEHRLNERYMTTKASLRSICLNDLYRHKNLGELAVEGDIHSAVSGLQMSVPWMPNERTTS